ncbi:MAG: ribonuclease D [Halioglobus sp.]
MIVHWRLIESDRALHQLLRQHAHCKTVIVDTEFMRRNTFYPEVALIQLCFVGDDASSDIAWLIDPLTISDREPLVELLTNPGVLKVLHSASEDLEVFQRWLGVLPQPLFDTQRAAALLDIGFGLGYRALVQEICSVDLPKGETRSDWLQRPLTESQCEYAAQDVTWLLPVWEELHQRCECQDKLRWVLDDGRDAIRMLGTDVENFHLRIKKAWKLDRRQVGILAAVCRWREVTARARDKPRSWIIDDEACLQLALKDPYSPTQLRDSVGLPSAVVRRYAEELLELLAKQRAVSEAELPSLLPPPLDAAGRGLIKRLKAQVRDIANELSVAPEVLVQSKDYELLLREQSGGEFQAPVHWLGWRNTVVFAPLRNMLASDHV